MTTTEALAAWGAYDRDDPFPVFADVRELGPVHAVTLADGHEAYLVVGYDEARRRPQRSTTVEGHARRARRPAKGSWPRVCPARRSPATC